MRLVIVQTQVKQMKIIMQHILTLPIHTLMSLSTITSEIYTSFLALEILTQQIHLRAEVSQDRALCLCR